jgi:Mg2+ and Co2+ transporter CorA
MAMLPCIFLRHHVEQTTGELKTLIAGVEKIEMTIKKKAEIKELHDQIRQLHACNTTLVKLERRWRFQTQLAESIHEFLDSHRESQYNRREMKIKIGQMHGGTVSLFNRGDVEEEAFDRTHLQNHPDFKALGNNVGFHKRLIRGAEYDLEVLSRRISNLFTAVSCYRLISSSILLTWCKIFNLIAQHDASATITLAKSSLDDSSSMKTIAIMTLLFLPATFLSVRGSLSEILSQKNSLLIVFSHFSA